MAEYFEGKWLVEKAEEIEQRQNLILQKLIFYGDTLMAQAEEILAKQVELKGKIIALKQILSQAANGVVSAAQAQQMLAGLDEMLALADPPAAPAPNQPVNDDNP